MRPSRKLYVLILSFIFYNKNMIQGYGVLKGIDGEVEIDPSAEILFLDPG